MTENVNQQSEGAQTVRARILVADDDPVLCELAASSLRTRTMDVELASDGHQAIRMIGETQYDLLITDLSMPGADGYDVIQAVRLGRSSPRIPIIVMTTSDDYASIERAYACGATSFCPKPVNWTLLNHHVRYVLRASRQEEEMRQAKLAAESASRLKSNLLSVITHEFRTPLHQIFGFTKLLINETEGPLGSPGYKDYAGHAHEAAGGLNSMLSDLLLMTRALADELKLSENETPLDELLKSAQEQAEAESEGSSVTVSNRVPEASNTLLLCDAGLIGRALQHVISNARKFSPQESQVTLSCMLAKSGALIITVQDQGPGMDSARVDELLQPFAQGDMAKNRSSEGVGIGLAIAKIAAEAHHGQLIIHSKPGEGTTVGLVLPAGRLINDQRPESGAEAASA